MARLTMEPNAALRELMEREGRPEPGPPPVIADGPPPPPAEPFRLEKPDWRREAEEAARRNAAAAEPDVDVEPANSLQPRPAAKVAKPKATPRLDAVRSWRP